MKYWSLLLKNVFRNSRRTVLTITSIAVSLFLVATLLTVLSELNDPPSTPESALRLITRHKVSLANPLPISHRQKIAGVNGVEAVVGMMWFGGVYKDPSNFFPQFAINADRLFDVAPTDLNVPQEQKDAFLQDRTGAIVGRKLANRFDWKVGDKIVLQGTVFQFNAELTIRGIYEGPDESSLYFHWDYFNESMGRLEFCGSFWMKARAAEEIPRIAQEVDALFQNTTAPTKTESEKAFVLGFVSMLGNVQFLITSICTVVIFAIVLVAANTMAMSIRERTREIGILKALGFKRSQILGLLLTESVVITLTGASLGAGTARVLYSSVDMAGITYGFIQRFLVTHETLLICALIGFGVGIVSAGVPALQAARRPVVEALRRVS